MDKNSKFQAALKAEPDIGKRIAMLAFDMSMSFNPYQAIRDWEVSNEKAKAYTETPIAAAATKLGIPFAELLGKEEKTEEELAAIREAEEELVQMHRTAFARTRYGRALLVLDALSSDPLPVGDEDTFPTSTEAVFRFFALHPEINPREDAAIESESLKELVSIYDELCNTPSPRKVGNVDHINSLLTARSHDATKRVRTIRLKDFYLPIDKLNTGKDRSVWSLPSVDYAKTVIPFKAEASDSKTPINIMYSINFAELGSDGFAVTKPLDGTDQRVYYAISSLYLAGFNDFTIRQLHEAMGNQGNPSGQQRDRILKSIDKMNGAYITIDNEEEIKIGKYNYPPVKYRGHLLVTNTYSIGNEVHITVTEEPQLTAFARLRGQITTIPMRVLIPDSKTPSSTPVNLAIENYLLVRIAHAKKRNGQRKILYSTVAVHAAIPAGQTKRVPDKVCRYLDHFVKKGHIASYKKNADGVEISLIEDIAPGDKLIKVR